MTSSVYSNNRPAPCKILCLLCPRWRIRNNNPMSGYDILLPQSAHRSTMFTFFLFSNSDGGDKKTNKSVPQKLFYVGWHSTVIRLAQLCRTDVSWWRPGWSPFFLPFCYFLFWWLSSLSRSKILCAARHDTSSYRRWVARPVRARSVPTGNYPGSPIRYLATFDVKSGSIILFF